MSGIDFGEGRLIVVSNRLPVAFERNPEGKWKAEAGTGGLVTALLPILKESGGVWVGWPGIPQSGAADFEKVLRTQEGFDLRFAVEPVYLTKGELRDFYRGFCNEVLWPIFHDLQSLCNFDPAYWRSFRRVNRKFAHAIRAVYRPNDYVWIHDYHLILAAREIKALGVDCSPGFFLHIPFPPPDIFLKIPWRKELLEGLLAFESVTFQTVRDRDNFIDCVRVIVPEAELSARTGDDRAVTLHYSQRQLEVAHYPISIDFEDFAGRAARREIAEEAWLLHEKYPKRQIILGLDRLDYTKGIPYRLKAFRESLRRHPELRGRVSLVQVVVPSRTRVPRYRALRTEIEQLVGAINGEYSRAGWIPVHYLYRSLSQDELLSYYRASEIALITPLKDGMNLIAKEYCACHLDERGVLILSEFAGAAKQLGGHCLLVNPYHLEEVADAIHRAFQMSSTERSSRMAELRRITRSEDVFWWVRGCLRRALRQRAGTVA